MTQEGTDRRQQQQQEPQQQPPGSTSLPGQDEPGDSARNTQGNLGTTQREWVGRDYAADSDEEPT